MAKRLGERLVDAGLITAAAIDQGLQQQRITGHRLGDCLVEIGLLGETALLRFLAAELNTRFVTAEKLARVKIAPDVLDKVPVRMAEAQCFLPISFDTNERVLTIVISEPQNVELLREIALVTEVTSVTAYVGLRSAIQAGIRKHYYSDPSAFAAFLASGAGGAEAAREGGSGSDSRSAPGLRLDGDTRSGAKSGARSGTGAHSPTQLREALGIIRGGALGDNDFVETLNVVVGLLEMGRPHLRGHSAQLARQASTIARRMGLPPREVTHIAIACYLHDLGKRPDRHFTLASCAHNAEWKSDAKRFSKAPLRLFEGVHLPVQVNAILAQLYEAFDGSGVPQGARGQDIAAGARIIAAVDAYLDLLKNPQNALGRVLSREEALSHLKGAAGALYDPAVVEILDQAHSGEFLRQRLLADGRQVLIAEPDPTTRHELMRQVAARGLLTHSASSLDGVIDAMLRGDAELLVVGIRFGIGDVSGIIQFLRSRAETASVPVAVLGEPVEPVAQARLAQSGVSLLIPLPLNATQAALHVETLFRNRIQNGAPGRPVTGGFDELSCEAVFRLMGASQKSGRLSVRGGGQEAAVYFEQGLVVNARFEEASGPEAIQALSHLTSGEFVWDPNALLLEPPQVEGPIERMLGPPAA